MPDKPLGRGLEEVSHLFLSQKTPVSSQPGVPAGIVVLRPGPCFSKDRLAAALMELEGAIEEGMRGIDANVPCDAGGDIDLIALDRANQLTVIDFDTTSNDGLLLRGLAHVDWAVRNTASLRRVYHGQPVNFSRQPRLVLVAPQFSPLLTSVARQIARPQVNWVRYHLVDVFGRTGILLEHLTVERPPLYNPLT